MRHVGRTVVRAWDPVSQDVRCSRPIVCQDAASQRTPRQHLLNIDSTLIRAAIDTNPMSIRHWSVVAPTDLGTSLAMFDTIDDHTGSMSLRRNLAREGFCQRHCRRDAATSQASDGASLQSGTSPSSAKCFFLSPPRAYIRAREESACGVRVWGGGAQQCQEGCLCAPASSSACARGLQHAHTCMLDNSDPEPTGMCALMPQSASTLNLSQRVEAFQQLKANRTTALCRPRVPLRCHCIEVVMGFGRAHVGSWSCACCMPFASRPHWSPVGLPPRIISLTKHSRRDAPHFEYLRAALHLECDASQTRAWALPAIGGMACSKSATQHPDTLVEP